MERRPNVIMPAADIAMGELQSKAAPGAISSGQTSPRPVLAGPRTDLLLIAILGAGLAAMLVLPTMAATVLSMAQAKTHAAIVPTVLPTGQSIGHVGAQAAHLPVDVTARTITFFLAAYGLWGLVIYVWASCVFSVTKGRSWAWGLLGLPALCSFILLWITGNPACGALGLLGVGGFLVPYGLAEDRLAVVSMVRRSSLSWGTALFAALGIFAGATLAYGNSFSGGMTLDNKYIIEEFYKTLHRTDPSLEVFSTTMIGYIFQNDYWWPKGISGLFRPLSSLSYWINYVFQDNQLDTFQYHVVNFLLHWFAAFLAFVLMRALMGRPRVAFFTALLFVTHPMATESVSNIIGRADILAAIAVFGGLLLYIASTKQEGVLKIPWLVALMLVTAIGLFSKESAISLVGVVIAYDIVYRWTLEDFREAIPSLIGFSAVGAIICSLGIAIGRFGALGLSEGLLPALYILLAMSMIAVVGLGLAWMSWERSRPVTSAQAMAPWWKFFFPYAAMVPPILGWIAARGWVFANSPPPETPFLDNPIRGLGFFAARMTASDVFLRLLALLAFPKTLSSDYSFNQIPLFSGRLGEGETWIAIAGVLTLLGILGLVVLTFRHHKTICFLILFYLLAYLPTSNFLLIIGSIMAERFTYLPLLGFVGCVVLGFEALGRRWAAASTDSPGSPTQIPPEIPVALKRSSLPAITVYSLLALIACAYGVRAWVRNNDWFSDITLWTSAAKASPVSFRSYQSKAFALFEQYNARQASGVYANNTALRDHDIDEVYQTAEHAKPIVDVLSPKENSSRLYLHLGMYYCTKGETLSEYTPDGNMTTTAEAVPWFRAAEKVLQEAVEIDRTFNGVNREKELQRKIKKPEEIFDVGLPPIYFYLGNTYAHLGEWDKALHSFQYMRHLDPVDADSYIRAASIYLQQGKPEDASISMIQAIVLNETSTNLWPLLNQTLAQINHSRSPALTKGPDGRVQIHTEIPEVRSVVCSAYQGLVRSFILAKRTALAQQFASVAVGPKEKGGWAFPAELFDLTSTAVNADVDLPVPPPPD